MKTIYMTMAAVSALAVAAPVAAQPKPDDRSAPQSSNGDRSAPQSWYGDRQNTHQLQARFDAGVESGAISRREAMTLRTQLRQLTQLERQYSRAGFSDWERRALRERSRALNLNIAAAERMGSGRFDRGDRFGANDRRDTRGDRFAGDVRIGQRFTDRQVALPMQYRDRYRDSDASYYRYDEDRIYQIDRVTGLIMAMFDIRG